MSKALPASQTRCVRSPAICLSTLYSYAQCTNCKGLKDKCSRCQRLFCRYWESSWLQRIWLWKGESSCEPSSFGERLSTNCSSPRGNTCLQSHPLTWGIKSTFLEFEICVCQYSILRYGKTPNPDQMKASGGFCPICQDAYQVLMIPFWLTFP